MTITSQIMENFPLKYPSRIIFIRKLYSRFTIYIISTHLDYQNTGYWILKNF